VYFYPGNEDSLDDALKFEDQGSLEVVMVSDSLTGNTGGSAVLQYCYEDLADEDERIWYDVDTLTFIGPTRTRSKMEDIDFSALSFRIFATVSGAQTTWFRAAWKWKKKPKA